MDDDKRPEEYGSIAKAVGKTAKVTFKVAVTNAADNVGHPIAGELAAESLGGQVERGATKVAQGVVNYLKTDNRTDEEKDRDFWIAVSFDVG